MIQKLLQAIDKAEAAHRAAGLRPIPTDTDIKYEAGRRIGVIQGLEYARRALQEALTASSKEDDDL